MDSETEYSITFYGLDITVDKVGGGTLGRAYEGDWTVSVKNGPVYVYDNDTLTTGTPKTHAAVARLAAEFASECIDGEA